MNYFAFLFITVLIATDENDHMPYQSFCNPSKHRGACSENINCRCLTIVPTGEQICTLQVNCTTATPCTADYTCNGVNSICVNDTGCNYQHLCYPIAYSSPDHCLPLTTTENDPT